MNKQTKQLIPLWVLKIKEAKPIPSVRMCQPDIVGWVFLTRLLPVLG